MKQAEAQPGQLPWVVKQHPHKHVGLCGVQQGKTATDLDEVRDIRQHIQPVRDDSISHPFVQLLCVVGVR